jgi:gamma-glutamylputrescine oxidase
VGNEIVVHKISNYMQQTPSGNILIGGCGFVAPNAGIGVWESLPTPVVQEAIEQVLPRIFPSLASNLRVMQRWAGLLGCTADMHPIVDYAPTLPGVIFVGGFSGHGMPFGMRFGQLLATAVTTGYLPPALSPFRLDRPSLKRWELP